MNANKLIHVVRKKWAITNKKYGFTTDPDPKYIARLIMHTITQFNQIPKFTFYSLDSTSFIDQYIGLLADGTYLFWGAHRYCTLNKIQRDKARDNAPFPTNSWIAITHKRHRLSGWLTRVKQVKAG